MVHFDNTKFLSLSKSQLIAIIHKLIDKINILEIRILELEEKLWQKDNRSKKNTIPFWVKPNVKKKTNGRRKKELMPQTNHRYSNFPATITEHVIFKRYYFSCKRRYYPTPDLSSYVIGKYSIGINLMVLISTMREEERQPIKTIQQHLKTFYHLKLSEGEIVAICHKVAFLINLNIKRLKKKYLNPPLYMPMRQEDGKMAITVTSGTSPMPLANSSFTGRVGEPK